MFYFALNCKIDFFRKMTDQMLASTQKIKVEQRPFLSSPDLFGQFPDFVAKILARRGVQSLDELDLKLKNLLQPTLKGLTQAVNLIDEAIDQQQKIMIVGDYDADGATSTALMILALRALGAKVKYIVPDRFKYGYGLTPAIANLAYEDDQPDLLITVDNGISSHEGVERAHQLGMKVVITDHHLTTKATPVAEAVVNPNQLGCTFPSKSLAGVGVAFYVLAALMSHRQSLQKSSVKMTQYLDLVALGTYADVASLDYNNRILVDAGVKRIQQRQCRLGILALLQIAKRDAEDLQAQDFGFVIGPRLNAAGRMDNMKIGVECLLADDWDIVYQLAEQLNQFNIQRRQVELEMKEQAMQEIEKIVLRDDDLPTGLVMFEADWHQGVIGIVAGRLKELYHRPSVVFAPDLNPEYLKGSARSIEGIHIRDVIERVAEQTSDVICYFGGHAAAAGLTIKKDKFDVFKTTFCQILQEQEPELFQAKLWTDGELSSEELNLSTIDWIDGLAPWGHRFPSPIFQGVFKVNNFTWLKEKHLKLWLDIGDGRIVEAIAFFAKDKWNFDGRQAEVFLVYTLEKNEFNGFTNLQLRASYLDSSVAQ